MTAELKASYFDGHSARAWPVLVQIVSRAAAPKKATLGERDETYFNIVLKPDAEVLGQAAISFPESESAAVGQLEEGFEGAPRRLELTRGGTIEFENSGAANALLKEWGALGSAVVRAQSSWRLAGLSAVAALFAVIVAFKFLIPALAPNIVNAVPLHWDYRLGEQIWPTVEQQFFLPSSVSPERQARILERFNQMLVPMDLKDRYQLRLFFRASRIGPNAIALPGGRMVVTDELLHLSNDDDAVLGVLAHEVGHVTHRHAMRNIVQTSALSVLGTLWLGDISWVAALGPSLLANTKYSRDLESEADDASIQLLHRAEISAVPLADLMERLGKMQGESKGGVSDLLSSHPVTAERVAKFRAAGALAPK